MLECIHVRGLFGPRVIQDLVGFSSIQENIGLSSYGKKLKAQTAPGEPAAGSGLRSGGGVVLHHCRNTHVYQTREILVHI